MEKSKKVNDVVVVGAGQAGLAVVARLRAKGFAGRITLIGAEPTPPYHRPPLSKAYLLGDLPREQLYLRPERYYDENDIRLLLGKAVSAIDASARTVTVGDSAIPYDALVLTTGSEPRRLPPDIGGSLGGVFSIRSLADIDAMAPHIRSGARVLIVGGGYIGLEAAAVAIRRGVKVTLIEMSERILQRVAAPETSAYFRSLHKKAGVDLREGVGLVRLAGDDNVRSAILTDGTILDLDAVLVGIGVEPSTALAEMTGLALDNGVCTNAFGETTAPYIWAAGDCASFPYQGSRIRLESVQNAIDQAECVADNLIGAGKAYSPKPWFWSDQYDTKLQIAGLNIGYDQVVERENYKDGISFWYFRDKKLLAVDAINDPRAYMVGKRLIDSGRSPSPASVTDQTINLKTLLELQVSPL